MMHRRHYRHVRVTEMSVRRLMGSMRRANPATVGGGAGGRGRAGRGDSLPAPIEPRSEGHRPHETLSVSHQNFSATSPSPPHNAERVKLTQPSVERASASTGPKFDG